MATEQQVLEGLRDLDPDKWAEVLDFIGYLSKRTKRVQAHTRPLTARDLLQSELVGLWADRRDIGDSVEFARQLRKQAEHRGVADDSA